MNNKIASNAYKKWLLENSPHLYDNAPFGYIVTQPNGTIIDTNQVLLDWLGYRKTDVLVQKKFQDLLSTGGKIYYETHHSPMEKMEGYTRELSYSLIDKRRRRIPVLVNTQVHANKYGKPLFTRIFIYNIAYRKKYEQELLLAKKKAEEAAETKANFLSMVSHEIRTPMNAIIGTTDLLLKNVYLPEQVELLNILNQSANNLLELINNVLDLSKEDANKMALDEKNMDLHQNTKTLVDSWQAKAKEKGIDLFCNIDSDIPTPLIGDAVKIGQVLNNLVGNAIKFTKKGNVTVSIQKKNKLGNQVELEFSVEDTGMGIAADRQKQIFEAFGQADASISSEYGGTGLGLAISQNIIHLHNSEIKVTSQLGQGSKFYFNLWFKTTNSNLEEPQIIKREASEKEELTNMKILLVEDNESNIFIASSYFERWNLEFDVARNGKIAIDFIQSNNYDLVLMDLRMPVMNGYQTTAAIRQLEGEKYKKLPIIALSASTKENLEFQSKRFKFNGYLLKPFNPDELYQFMKSYQNSPDKNISVESDKENMSKIYSHPLAFSVKSLEEFLDNDEEAIQSFIPVVLSDLGEAKKSIEKSIFEQDLEQFRNIIHKNNTIFRMLETNYLNELIMEVKQTLSGESTGNLDTLNSKIKVGIEELIKALEERKSLTQV